MRFPPSPGAGLLQDLLHAELDAFEPARDPRTRFICGWRVFFPTPGQRDQARTALASALGDRLLALSPIDVEDEDWARRSQASLEAVHIGADHRRSAVGHPAIEPGSGTRDPDNHRPLDGLRNRSSCDHEAVPGVDAANRFRRGARHGCRDRVGRPGARGVEARRSARDRRGLRSRRAAERARQRRPQWLARSASTSSRPISLP